MTAPLAFAWVHLINLMPQCGTHFRSFYMIVATESNTDVDVYYRPGVELEDEHFSLDPHEVFTMDTYEISGRPLIDLTGTRVVATKPVAVYSGVAWTRGLYASVRQGYILSRRESSHLGKFSH